MHERVRAVGGELRIDSQPGAGTTVEVALPAARIQEVLHDAARPVRPGKQLASLEPEPGSA